MTRLHRAAGQPQQRRTTGTDDVSPTASGVLVESSYIQVGEGYAATLVVTGYPAQVGPAWLEALLAHPARIDVAIHVDPVPPVLAAPMLKRRRARLESTRRLDNDHGRLGDPLVEATAADAAALAERVARGASKLFRVGIYVTVHARTLNELREACDGVRATAASILLETAPATFRHLHGYTTTLPLGVDRLGVSRVLDTAALAAAFPFASSDVPAPAPGERPTSTPVLYGVNTNSTGVLMWDRWAGDNHNSVVLARSGAGKSYFVKLDVLRNLYQGVTVSVIDPEDEYAALAHMVGGRLIQLGTPGARINPLALPPGDRRPDALQRRTVMLHTVISMMLGAVPSPPQQAALDRAIPATYRTAGITHDPTTWTRRPPSLKDLADTLTAQNDADSKDLAKRLHPWTHGSFADLFNEPDTTQASPDTTQVSSGTAQGTPDSAATAPDGASAAALTVWSLRHLPDEVRTVVTYLVLSTIWQDIDRPDPGVPDGPARSRSNHRDGARRRRHLVVVDEAWLLLRDGEGAKFLNRMAKAARKRAAGLTVVTQDAADVLGSDLGLAVVSNSAVQILMRQAPQAIDAVQTAFALTGGEARMLLNAPRGEGLFLAGTTRVAFRALAAPEEARVAQTGIGDHP